MTIDDKDEMATAMRKVLSELNLPINKKTKEFVYAFITENGGIEKLNKDLNRQKQAAPVPPRVPPMVTNGMNTLSS
jgi:hypothetical protein